MPIALILLLVTTALSVVMLFVLTSLIDSKVAGVREWAQANGIAVLGLLLFAARGVVPDVLSIEVANGLLLVTIALMYLGFRRHLSLPVSTLPLVLGGVLALGGVAVFHYLIDSVPLRIVSVSIYHAAVCFGIAASIGHSVEPRLRYPFGFTCAAAFVLGAAHAFRGAFYAVQSWAPSASDDAAAWNLAFVALGTLALPAVTLGAVMMANAKVLFETAYAADHDHLTGAWSRRAFFRFAEHEHARAERKGGPLSLLVFDADHFKRINDTHGHATGDRVLRAMVAQAQEIIRKIDYCARTGGEEFAVLLPDANLQTALDVAARLRTALDSALHQAPSTIRIGYTVSIGVATLARDETLVDLMARADAALYAAKAGGRNRVVSAPVPARVERTGGRSESRF
ncbi:diguanylate cyclase [Massilia sp. CMS3.1]|uniref:GGDEF domain-containing protein n=1 Tax=Massilia sp. CMS3.1 TaxID=3373083 RepID=UPI003EE46264